MFFDRLIIEFDRALRTVFAAGGAVRPVPGEGLPEASLDAEEKVRVVALMRVNHSGEVCAQALYQGQALACRNESLRRSLTGAAQEETEHLAWTSQRIGELGGRKSALNPLWYLGAFSLGVVAARLGDGWNLGFLAETERQVEAHLDSHLVRLPEQDARSRAILVQMKFDEASHADEAVRLGALELPMAVKVGMRIASRIMTRTAYYI
ncbi:MAG: demethoxyubiquinone hydroxylase family protein [Candidatus Accumulibacter sp. 66-26]|nr:MAG: demethoxyubiquinone hydroxylase family protein [Candidatus Accumulibacter sp. 66-26]